MTEAAELKTNLQAMKGLKDRSEAARKKAEEALNQVRMEKVRYKAELSNVKDQSKAARKEAKKAFKHLLATKDLKDWSEAARKKAEKALKQGRMEKVRYKAELSNEKRIRVNLEMGFAEKIEAIRDRDVMENLAYVLSIIDAAKLLKNKDPEADLSVLKADLISHLQTYPMPEGYDIDFGPLGPTSDFLDLGSDFAGPSGREGNGDGAKKLGPGV